MLYLNDFRSRRLNTIAATSPFEQKNRKTTQNNALKSIEMVGIFLFIWYSEIQYASIFILWWGQRGFKAALVVTGTYCELLTCISVVVSVVGGVKGTKNALSLDVLLLFHNVYQRRRHFVCVCGGGGGKGNLKIAALVLKGTFSSSLTCINIVVFVGVWK